MQVLNLKYRCDKCFHKEDFNAYIFDWITTTRDLRYYMDIEEKDDGDYNCYQYQKKKLNFVDYSDEGFLTAYHTDTDLNGTEWRLSIVYKFEVNELYIQMSNSDTSENGKFLRAFRKPDLIDYLVDDKVIRKDGNITISAGPHYIYKENVDEIKKIINNEEEYSLPVIYLTLTPYGYYANDPEELADRYAGIAHVFAQYDEKVSEALEGNYIKDVPRNGAIAIYFSLKSLRTNIFPNSSKNDKKTLDNMISKAISFFYKDRNFGTLTTYDEISSFVVAERNSRLIEKNQNIISENIKVNEENRSIVETFDLDLKKVEEENRKLKEKLSELETENSILKKRLENREKHPLLYSGREKEIYPGEIKELLIDILKNAPVAPESRREDLIKDIVSANNIESSLARRQAEIKDVLNEYRSITPDMIARLEKLGFTVTGDGKHLKLRYGDDRYIIPLAKTPSDVRSGKQAAMIIVNKVM